MTPRKILLGAVLAVAATVALAFAVSAAADRGHDKGEHRGKTIFASRLVGSKPAPTDPALHNVAPGGVPPKVRVACDRLAADQVVVLLAGELQFDALNKIAAGVTPEFELTGLPAGPQRLVARIRVDGVDSIPLASPQPGQPLPADFDQAQEISLP